MRAGAIFYKILRVRVQIIVAGGVQIFVLVVFKYLCWWYSNICGPGYSNICGGLYYYFLHYFCTQFRAQDFTIF